MPLTMLRIIAIPLVVALYYLPYHWSDRPLQRLVRGGCHHGFAGRFTSPGAWA
jgi:hypothetical protein